MDCALSVRPPPTGSEFMRFFAVSPAALTPTARPNARNSPPDAPCFVAAPFAGGGAVRLAGGGSANGLAESAAGSTAAGGEPNGLVEVASG